MSKLMVASSALSYVQHLLEVLPDFLIYISHFRGSCGSLFSHVGGHSQLWKGGDRLDLLLKCLTSSVPLELNNDWRQAPSLILTDKAGRKNVRLCVIDPHT